MITPLGLPGFRFRDFPGEAVKQPDPFRLVFLDFLIIQGLANGILEVVCAHAFKRLVSGVHVLDLFKLYEVHQGSAVHQPIFQALAVKLPELHAVSDGGA